MFELPTNVTVGETTFNIRNKGDFRMILDCFTALQDIELEKEERVITALIIFYEGIDSLDDVFTKLPNLEQSIKEMYKFFNCGQEEANGLKTNYKLVDWKQDEQLIASAINNVANTEIRALPYIHWWTFLGYYTAIGECPFSNIISIRYKIARGKKLEKYEQEFKRDNPQYFSWNASSVEKQEADELVKQLWNSGE